MKKAAIVILNGPPRSGKTSVARALQQASPDPWINLGVDLVHQALGENHRPSIGLRPGGERPDLEPLVASLYLALYASANAFADQGINVVLDVGHHDDYSQNLGLFPQCLALIKSHRILKVGVHCPLEEILRRRAESNYLTAPLEPILRWQTAVHQNQTYDLELHTDQLTPDQSAKKILDQLKPNKKP